MDLAEAADDWSRQIEAWSVGSYNGVSVTHSPEPVSGNYFESAMFAATADLTAVLPHRLAAEVLPPSGGTITDVGCGVGASSLPLAGLVDHIVAIDEHRSSLAAFAATAASLGVSCQTIAGAWPELADDIGPSDVVVCHHVAYVVRDIVEFLERLTTAARLAVVMVIPERHPYTAWSAASHSLLGIERPTGPTATDAVRIVRALGLAPEVMAFDRPDAHPWRGRSSDVEAARRRLGLGRDRTDELAAFLTDHPPRFVQRFVAMRWAGTAEFI